MSSDTEAPPGQQAAPAVAMDIVDDDATGADTNGVPHSSVEVPSTPLGSEVVIPASQETLLSTEGPGSPMDADESFRTELNDDDDDIDVDAELPSVIPSSLTPPSSQRRRHHQPQPPPQQQQQQQQQQQRPPPPPFSSSLANGYLHTSASQRSAILSPPGTGINSVAQARREAAAAGLASNLSGAHSGGSGAGAGAAAGAGAGAFSSAAAVEFVPPTPAQLADASPHELRALLQASLAEHTRLKTETAHHKLQYNLLTMQVDEDAKRAAVEHEMTRREVEALRLAESARQARRELSSTTATESSQAKYRQLKTWYDETVEENETLQKRVKLAKRVIQQKEEEIAALLDEKELLLNRLRENREHFHLLCSPGGLFHGAMTPKPQGSPVHTRATPFQTPKRGSAGVGKLLGRDAAHGASAVGGGGSGSASAAAAAAAVSSAEPFAALLQALNQENSSAPNTPLAGHRAPPRHPAKHVRNAQSMSSLPTTPTPRPPRSEYAGLLPSVDLVPQTEPPRGAGAAPHRSDRGHGHGHSHSMSHALTSASGRYFPETPTRVRHRLPGHQERTGTAAAGGSSGRRSRESTISADEDRDRDRDSLANPSAGSANEDLARQALESVAARAAAADPAPPPPSASFVADAHVTESEAIQAASAMLRRDARDSFELAAAREASARDGAGATTADRSAKLQAKLFGGVHKAGSLGVSTADKRKFSGGVGGGQSHAPGGASDASLADRPDRRVEASPTKKVRIVPSLRDSGDSYRHHHSYQQQQRELQQQQQRQQEEERVGLGIRYD